VSAPEHTTPRRARAYLVTDDNVARTVERYARSRPALDDVSRAALEYDAPAEPGPWYLRNPHRDVGEPDDTPADSGTTSPEGALWAALCAAPEDGADIGDLMRASGMGRSTLYRYLAQLAQAGRALQVGWGRWRAITPGQAHDE
jgi:hypothetical protein